MVFKRMGKIQEALRAEIDKFDKAGLNSLIGECQKLDEFNCSWIKYGLKDIVIKMAKTQLRWLGKEV